LEQGMPGGSGGRHEVMRPWVAEEDEELLRLIASQGVSTIAETSNVSCSPARRPVPEKAFEDDSAVPRQASPPHALVRALVT